MKNNKIKFPKTVKVGGMIYNIIFPYIFIDQPTYLGLHNGVSTAIRIADTYQECKRENQIILEIYIHELLHAIDFVYGLDNIDEPILGVYARALLQVLQDNELYLYNTKMPKKIKIGCFTYKVNFPYASPEISKTKVATTSNSKLIISIDDNDGSEKFNRKFIKVVLIHGIMSAISCVYFNGEDESQSIIDMKRTSISHGLYQVFVDNKVDILINKYKTK